MDSSLSNRGDHTYIIQEFEIAGLNSAFIARHSAADNIDPSPALAPVVHQLHINYGLFTINGQPQYPVSVILIAQRLEIACPCPAAKQQLCQHQSSILQYIARRDELRVFFDEALRHSKLRKFGTDYGLENEQNPDDFFEIAYQDKKLLVTAKQGAILPVTRESLHDLQALLMPVNNIADLKSTELPEDVSRCLIIKAHKYYGHLMTELYEAKITKAGKIKNPLKLVNPLDLLFEFEEPEVLKFFTAVSRFQNNIEKAGQNPQAIDSLRAIAKNPLQLSVFYHNTATGENVTATSLTQVALKRVKMDVALTVNKRDDFYVLSGQVKIGTQAYALASLDIRFTYFILINQTLYLVDNPNTLALINFFKKKANDILIHQTRFKDFKAGILTKLEDNVAVDYQYIKPGNTDQLKEQGFTQANEKIIYLSDFGTHVMIIPVLRYGEAEISIRTKKPIYALDNKGAEFLVKRHVEEELNFTALLIRQHPYFAEQLDNDLYYFYLQKKWFLNEDWFLPVFDDWQKQGITILGFNELEGNKLNANKAQVTIHVQSGINWFNAKANVRFGRSKASLKQVHKAVRNKSKYVQLDDGTLGILPAEWMEKFAAYFSAGEVADHDTIQIAKTNYLSISQLYEDAMLDEFTRHEISIYNQRLADFSKIGEIEPPEGLNGTLRHYQMEGLSWLNFLDDFNFGGCLADDMGLGKTIQIIAFVLLQRQKAARNTNLLIVPTSLLFNWQAEVKKFAPSIKMYTIYGAGRIKSVADFDAYELIMTSYGTLLSDINFLKNYTFNYIFLDESQHIKNPSSQRYKAACLLKSRNKIVITGTPIENNTFDLYGQLSFACPGLLGSKQYFKDIYAMPIDKFKVSKRARELQEKIKPFILRRTKKQVATELPDKTEMVLYCDMQPEQRKIYDAYEKEFREFISATTSEQLPRSSMHVLKGLTKLRQICNSPLLLSGVKVPGESSSKITTLMDEIVNKATPHKVLIFSQFVSMLDLIRKELIAKNIGHSYLTGSTRNREAVVNDFEQKPDVRVFLISLKAGGTGLNLTAADYVYIVDPWWNPAVENQAIDRCYRIGQKKNVVAVRLICPDTIEEKIMKLQQTKMALSEGLIETDTSFFKSLSKTDLMDMLDHQEPAGILPVE